MNIDHAFCIAIRSKYKLIGKFACVSKHFDKIWYYACKEQFPDKQYFDFWTGFENYMVMYKNMFCLAVNGNHVEKELYEYDPILQKILNLSSDVINYDAGYNIHTLLTFQIQHQYILLFNDLDYEWTILSHHDTHESAENEMDQLMKCEQFRQKYEEGINEEVEMMIVNLEYLTPTFFGIKNTQYRKYVKQPYYTLQFPNN